MPVSLSSVPGHIRISIVQKLDAHDFGRFKASSQLSYDDAKKLRTKVVISMENFIYAVVNNGDWEFDLTFYGLVEGIYRSVRSEVLQQTPLRIDARVICVQETVTQELCEKLTKVLQSTNSSCGYLHVRQMTCTPDGFNNLLEASKAHTLVIGATIPKEFLKVPAMKSIDAIDIDCFLDDDDLMSLKMRNMRLRGTNITCSGLNKFLKEHFHHKRNIEELYVGLKANEINESILLNEIAMAPKNSSNSTGKSRGRNRCEEPNEWYRRGHSCLHFRPNLLKNQMNE